MTTARLKLANLAVAQLSYNLTRDHATKQLSVIDHLHCVDIVTLQIAPGRRTTMHSQADELLCNEMTSSGHNHADAN